MDVSLDKTSAINLNSRESNEFIKWYHQSRIPNLRKNFMNICDDFFFNPANWEKMYFGPTRSLFSFSTAQTEKNVWKKLVKQIGENIWWIRYRIRLFLCIFNRFSLPLVHWSERNMVLTVPISSEGHNFKFSSKLIDDRYQFFSTCNKYFRVKHDL